VVGSIYKYHLGITRAVMKRGLSDLWTLSRVHQAFYSGTTAVMGLVRGNKIYVANCGDSRCTMATIKNGKLVAQDLSIDQVRQHGKNA
jgi:hypothetical protein